MSDLVESPDCWFSLAVAQFYILCLFNLDKYGQITVKKFFFCDIAHLYNLIYTSRYHKIYLVWWRILN